MLIQLREKLNVEDVKLLEELLIQEGILFEPPSVEEESDIEDLTLQIISSLQTSVEKLTATADEVRMRKMCYNLSLTVDNTVSVSHFQTFRAFLFARLSLRVG